MSNQPEPLNEVKKSFWHRVSHWLGANGCVMDSDADGTTYRCVGCGEVTRFLLWEACDSWDKYLEDAGKLPSEEAGSPPACAPASKDPPAYEILIPGLPEMRKDRDRWKANHDEMVARNKVLRDRVDLQLAQERLNSYALFAARLCAKTEGQVNLSWTTDGMDNVTDVSVHVIDKASAQHGVLDCTDFPAPPVVTTRQKLGEKWMSGDGKPDASSEFYDRY